MSQDVEARLKRSAPVVDVGKCGFALGDLVDEITTSRRRPVFASRRRRLAATSAALAVFVPTAAVAAVQFAAETGHYGNPGATENDTSEYINMCASDTSSYMSTLEPRDLALPAGVTWGQIGQRQLEAWQTSCPPRDTGMIMQVTGIKGAYVVGNACAWEKDFLEADGPDAANERRRASQGIVQAQDALVRLGVDTTEGTQPMREHAARGDAAWLAYYYEVNCLGRNTTVGVRPHVSVGVRPDVSVFGVGTMAWVHRRGRG